VNRLALVVRQNLLRCLKDPAALILWLFIPLLIGTLLVLAVGGRDGPKPRVHLLIADEDGSFGSRLLTGALTSDRTADFVQAEKVDRGTGRQRLEKGDASALLVIPKGFAQAVLREQPTRLLLLTNPAQRILPGIAEEMLRLLSEAVFYAHRLLGPELHQIARAATAGESVMPDADISRLSVSLNDAIRGLRSYLFPPVIKLESIEPPQPASSTGGAVAFATSFLPGIVLMAMLFAAQGLSNDIWRERETGVLRRMFTTPLDLTSIVLGKVLAAAVVLAGTSGVILAAGMAYLEMPLARWPLAVAWSAGSGAVLMLLLLVIQLHASSHRAASFLTSSVVFPLLMLGGSMFPLAAMPRWMAAVGACTPNGWASIRMNDLLAGQATGSAVAAGFLSILVAGALLFFWSRGRLAGFARR
jgi:ABC-type multidrug transport system permease subunit